MTTAGIFNGRESLVEISGATAARAEISGFRLVSAAFGLISAAFGLISAFSYLYTSGR